MSAFATPGESQFLAGQVAFAAGKFEEARAAFMAASEIYRDLGDAKQTSFAAAHASRCQLATRDFADARMTAGLAIMGHHMSAVAHEMCGTAHFHCGMYPNAIEHLTIAVEDKGKTGIALFDRDAAIKLLAEAKDLATLVDPESLDSKEHIGRTLFKGKHYAQASQSLIAAAKGLEDGLMKRIKQGTADRGDLSPIVRAIKCQQMVLICCRKEKKWEAAVNAATEIRRMCQWFGRSPEVKPFTWVGFYQVGVAVYKCPRYQRLGVPEIVAANFDEARQNSPPPYAVAKMAEIEAALAKDPAAGNEVAVVAPAGSAESPAGSAAPVRAEQ